MKTEMPLSNTDIERISKLGYKIKDFALKLRDEWQLKNQHGRCVFLSNNGCAIYADRPDGCRLYPLVFDEESRRYMKDDFCPYREEFKVTKNDEKKLALLLTAAEEKNDTIIRLQRSRYPFKPQLA